MLRNQQLSSAPPQVSHNLMGQRLGRKGLETRERILAAALQVLELREPAPMTLTRIAREAGIGMTTLYLYFPDFSDLLLAALQRVMETADAAFMDRMRTRWPDDNLLRCALDFLNGYHQFWVRNSQILRMRNSFADAGNLPFIEQRNHFFSPIIDRLVFQMDGPSESRDTRHAHLAAVLVTGFEHVSIVTTRPSFHTDTEEYGVIEAATIDSWFNAEAEIITLVIQKQRLCAAKESANQQLEQLPIK